MLYKIPLLLSPQPEGGYTVTSPVLPELITEGDSADEALENARDALAATIEIYEDANRPLPPGMAQDQNAGPVWLETLIGSP